MCERQYTSAMIYTRVSSRSPVTHFPEGRLRDMMMMMLMMMMMIFSLYLCLRWRKKSS